ncbi:hypothetical protein RB595_007220 [Gaeumannomyces hyphopodioides]
MSLCEICKSIPLGTLPPFPSAATPVAIPEAPQYHHFVLNNNSSSSNNNNNDPPSLGFRYHEDRGGLWQSAAGGCGLCRLVEQQARRLVAVGGTEDAAAAPGRQGPHRAVPNFDLWVTARGGGAGDGFWVLSRCGDADRPDDAVAVVAAVGFCVDKDDPLATVVRGRPVEEVPGETAFGLARDWLAERPEEQSSPPSTLPPRLVDVGDPATDGSTVTIVEPDPGGDNRYIALGYSSPEEPQAARSAPDVGSVLGTKDLPQTFKDAVALTRELGLRHLWIDALCGPHPPGLGDPSYSSSSSSSYSERTAEIYGNAHLTVAAPGAAADGLFVRRRAREYVPIPYPGAAGTPSSTVLAYPLPLWAEVAGLHGELASGPLSQRVRVLSRRVLHFSADQIFFEGDDARFMSEEGLVGPRWRH